MHPGILRSSIRPCKGLGCPRSEIRCPMSDVQRLRRPRRLRRRRHRLFQRVELPQSQAPATAGTLSGATCVVRLLHRYCVCVCVCVLHAGAGGGGGRCSSGLRLNDGGPAPPLTLSARVCRCLCIVWVVDVVCRSWGVAVVCRCVSPADGAEGSAPHRIQATRYSNVKRQRGYSLL